MQSIEGVSNSVYLTAYPIGKDSLYFMKLISNRFVIIDKTKLLGDGKFEQNGLLFPITRFIPLGDKEYLR